MVSTALRGDTKPRLDTIANPTARRDGLRVRCVLLSQTLVTDRSCVYCSNHKGLGSRPGVRASIEVWPRRIGRLGAKVLEP